MKTREQYVSQPPTQQKFEELESIRGIAAILVVVLHVSQLGINEILQSTFIHNCYLMVSVFFVISGFVIHNAYSKKISTIKNLFEFQFLRFARLYPIHLIFLLVYFIFECSKYFAEHKLGLKVATPSFNDKNYSYLFILNLFLIQSLWEHYENTLLFNAPSWSISVEFYTYLIFGIIILNLNKYKNLIFIILSSLSVYLFVDENFKFISSELCSCFGGFFIGCLTSELLTHIKIQLNKYVSSLVLISTLIFLLVKTSPTFDPLIYLFTSLLIFSLLICPNGLLNKLLKAKYLIWIGTISYSIYMYHNIVIRFSDVIIRKVMTYPKGFAYGNYRPQIPIIDAFILLFSILMIVLFVSSILYYFIESPMRKKSREFIFSKQTSPLHL